MDDGIHTLAYGHKDITAKVASVWEGPELFLITPDEAKSKGLHPSHPLDPNMVQPRAPKKSMWQARSKTALDKAKKRILEGMTGDKPAAINDESDESSDEEGASKHKTALSYHSTTSPSLDVKPNCSQTIASSSYPTSSTTLNDIKPTQSTDPLPSPPMSPTSDSEPFASVDDSLSSDDSIF